MLQLQGIFTHVPAKWTAELLYIPYVIPFVVVSCVTLLVFRRDLREGGVTWRQPFGTAWGKVRGECGCHRNTWHRGRCRTLFVVVGSRCQVLLLHPVTLKQLHEAGSLTPLIGCCCCWCAPQALCGPWWVPWCWLS